MNITSKQQALNIICDYHKRGWDNVENPAVLDEYIEWLKLMTEKEWERNKQTVIDEFKNYDRMVDDWSKGLDPYRTPSEPVKSQYSKEQLEEIQKKSTLSEKFTTNKKEFLRLFGCYSVGNELMGEMLYHCLLGLICKINDAKITTVNNKKVDAVSHLITIQDTGSGKDQAMDFFVMLVNKINNLIKEHNLKSSKKFKHIRFYEISGSETPEALLDSYEISEKNHYKLKDKQGQEIKATPGILSSHDLIIARECSFLFSDKSSGPQSKKEIFLQALEGRVYNKALSGWRKDNKLFKTETLFRGVLIGTSRPVFNMKAHLAYSGLQQRALNLCREIDRDICKEMNQKLRLLRRRMPEEKEQILRDTDKLCLGFFKLLKFLNENDITTPRQYIIPISDVIGDNMEILNEEIFTEFVNKEQRGILRGFVMRFHHHVDILAFQNALSRSSKEISIEDVQNALSLLKRSYELLKIWVSENIQMDWMQHQRENRERIRNMQILKLFDSKKFIDKKSFNFLVQQQCNVKYHQARKIILDMLDKDLIINVVKGSSEGFEKKRIV